MAQSLKVSSTYISQVLVGKKTLTLEQACMLAQYLSLDSLETEYFYFLIQLERAGTVDLKKYFEKKLLELKTKSLKIVNRIESKKTLTENEKSVFYSSPQYSSIHIYCATHEEGRTLEDISQRFGINRLKVNEISQFLISSGLCLQKNGRIVVSSLGTHLEFNSPHLLKHHTNWRLRAIKAAESLSESELMYTVNVALSEKDFNSLREEMVIYIKQFLKTIYPSPSEKIACFNLDWFWIRD